MENLKVLLIEDDAASRGEIVELLGKEGYTAFSASDGKEGIVRFETDNPDVVITDLRMPEMDGLQVLKTIHERAPDQPVILLTAYGETDIALEAIRLGALDYLKKPIDIGDLLLALGRAEEKVSRNRKVSDFPRVLIAEDDELSRKNLAGVLRKEDLRVIEATNGAEAVELFCQNKVDITLLDIKMPKLDGIGALKKMRQINDDFEAIILTGYGDESTAIAALREGALNFIRKPIDLEEILALIDKAREKISLERALKFRIREVDLAYQIIAQLTERDEILIQLSEDMLANTKVHAANLVNLISEGIMLIDENMAISFANKTILDSLDDPPTFLTPELATKLFKKTDRPVDFEELKESVEGCLAGEPGRLVSIGQDDRANVIITKARLKIQGTARNLAIVIVSKMD